MTAPSGPLTGVRVLDFTANMSGPYATMILGDQGAEVTKVEPPAGDLMRGVGPKSGGLSAYYANLNRSKRSIVVDLGQPSSNDVVQRLLDETDVVVQNFRPGVAERVGLDAETVRGHRPGIVHVSINGYGPEGPYSDRPAYDQVIQAMSGFATRQAGRDGRPSMVRQGIIDKLTGMAAAQAVTAALVARGRTGEGQDVEVRMLDVAVATLWPDGMMAHTLVEPNEPQSDIARSFGLIETSDGHLSYVLVTNARLKRLAEALGLPGAEDVPTAGPISAFGELLRDANALVSRMTTDEAVSLLVSLDIPVAPAVELPDLHAHPQVVATGCIDEFEHPVLGKVRQANPAVRFAGRSARRLRPASHLGHDSVEILTELGFTEAEIRSLEESGAVISHNERQLQEERDLMSSDARLGNCFEDFEEGQIFQHPLGRTVSEADNTWLTLLTMNTNELHFNSDMAGRTSHGRALVNSGITLAIVLGISVSDMSQNAFANLGWDEIKLTGPVFAGDTIYAESLVTGVRESRSRPDVGIVSCFTRGLNQDGAEIMTFRRSMMVLKREAVRELRSFPTAPTDLGARAAAC